VHKEVFALSLCFLLFLLVSGGSIKFFGFFTFRNVEDLFLHVWTPETLVELIL